MTSPEKCRICRAVATIMCTDRDCLQFFCNKCPLSCPVGSCDNSNHQTMCWDRHIPFWMPGAAEAHRQCSLEDQEFVNEMFYCESDPERQTLLHQQDRKTLWFIAEPGEEITDFELPSGSPIRRDGTVHVTNRLNSILTKGTSSEEQAQLRFPTLVTFLGETGAGKSTLIRALIKESSGETRNANSLQQSHLETPVVQTSSTQHLAHPTSSGVHLYKDPETFGSSNPILYADCEGFNAGGISAVSFPQNLATDKDIVVKISVTASSYTTSAEIEDLYAKSLYTFSDTVCFVIKNPQTAAKSMERLLLWAVKGSGTSLHMLPQKSLILVLNGPRLKHNEHIMDENALRAIFLETGAKFWENDPVLKGISNTVFKNAPVTAEKFLLLYFSSVKALYIPDGSHRGVVHPGDIRMQVRKLHIHIRDDVRNIMDIRRDRWTQYNEWDFKRLFKFALKHFATSDDVFDFSEATKSSSLGYRELEDHVLAIRRQFTFISGENHQARFSSILASALVNKALHEELSYFNSNLKWGKYRESCRKAIDRFHKQFQTCQFTVGSEQCVLKFIHHGSGHRATGGEIIADGGFQPSLEEIENLVNSEVGEVAKEFNTQYLGLFQDQERISKYPTKARVVKHRKDILLSMYDSNYPFYSYRTCFSCLDAIPDHVLPCGHAYCETCVTDFCDPLDELAGAFTFEKCIFDGTQWAGNEAQIVQTQPALTGVRILTLEGGGVRGILELATLGLLEEMIGLDIHISAFFDLIVGTSVGGIIALAVGVEEMKLLDMKKEFARLATATFTSQRAEGVKNLGLFFTILAAAIELPVAIMTGGIILLTGWGASVFYYQSIYKTGPLKNGIQELMGTDTSIFGSAIRKHKQRSTRVAVMTMKEGAMVTGIANYNRPLSNSPPDSNGAPQEVKHTGTFSSGFERADNEEDELKAWEAALATSAIHPYLKPFKKASSGITYVDYGIRHNNPTSWAVEEYGRIWGQPGSEAQLDILVSLETKSLTSSKKNMPRSGQEEVVWSDSMRRQIHHLDAPIECAQCDPDHYNEMDTILHQFNQVIARQDLDPVLGELPILTIQPLRERINFVAHLLVAKLFFFEPTGPVMSVPCSCDRTLYKIEGKILCRLQQGSSPLVKLMERIVGFSAAERESDNDLHQISATEFSGVSSIDITRVKEAVRDGKKFEINHTITTSNPDRSFQAICIEFRHRAVVPPLEIGSAGELSRKISLDCISTKLAISGFPRKFYGEKPADKVHPESCS